jgi:anti-anti-sigma factor
MPASPFEVVVRHRDGMAVIDMSGDITAAAGPGLNAAYDEAAAAGAMRILLNFADVDYVNSTGIALIVGVLARSRSDSRPIMASGLDEHYREIFTITRLSDFMALYPDEESAAREDASRTI